MDKETAWFQKLEKENRILRGFLTELLLQTDSAQARKLAHETIKKLQAIGVRDLDALLSELL